MFFLTSWPFACKITSDLLFASAKKKAKRYVKSSIHFEGSTDTATAPATILNTNPKAMIFTSSKDTCFSQIEYRMFKIIYIEMTNVNFIVILRDIAVDKISSKKHTIIAVLTEIAPEANGRFDFFGCRRSSLMSK